MHAPINPAPLFLAGTVIAADEMLTGPPNQPVSVPVPVAVDDVTARAESAG